MKAETLLSASDAAAAAARTAGVEIRDLEALPDVREVGDLFAEVWGKDSPPVHPDLLRAFALAGNQVTGAYTGGRLCGATCGFLGIDGHDVHLHSHITGVRLGTQGRAVGFALKQHQRAWALARGVTTVKWTFDPLVRRNAYFNLAKLGATVRTYLENVYGEMVDELNAGTESDRAVALWELESDRATSAASARAVPPGADDLRRRGAKEILTPDLFVTESTAPTLLAWVPEDIVAVRRSDPGLAHRWRTAQREALGTALSAGYAATGMTRDGWYVLEQ